MKERRNLLAMFFVIILLASTRAFGQQIETSSSVDSNLKILHVEFEPIRQGKNVLRVKVQNNSEKEQTFGIHIYTRSPEYGKGGIGWGTIFFGTIKAHRTEWTRFVYKIQGPITESTYLWVTFYNPDSEESYDSKKWFEERRYVSSDLEHYKPDQSRVKPASGDQAKAVTSVFRQIQGHIRGKKYEQAWAVFTKDYQDAEFQFNGFKRFKEAMESPLGFAIFVWDKNQFLELKAKDVTTQNGLLTLTAVSKDQTWKIDFVQEDGRWKVDWIAGYTPAILLKLDWQSRLLPKMEKRSTKHFDIYYYKDSTAQKQINLIAEQKEKGFREICDFLGQDSDLRIRMVLFEDGNIKLKETGHMGNGWAFGNTIVEVYNEKTKLDPYHETAHILMGPLGDPPAMFNEGFAVYMSERLGAPALKYLGGGQAALYQRVRELKSKGEWIALEELLTYSDIGSRESRPRISYAEAGAFVKFLIDKYGKGKFLKAYKALKNSDDKGIQQHNKSELARIYGKHLKDLEKEWHRYLEEKD